MILFSYRSFLMSAIAGFFLACSVVPTMADEIDHHDNNLKDVSVEDGILQLSKHYPNRASGFFTIQNRGSSDLLLKSITSPSCSQITSNHNGQEMIQISGDNDDIFKHLAIPHESTMVFPAAGYHLQCHGINHTLQNNEKIPFTFHFLNEGVTTAFFIVRQRNISN